MKKSIHNRIDVASLIWERKKRDDQMFSAGVYYVIASFSSNSHSICDSKTDITRIRAFLKYITSLQKNEYFE